MRFSDKVAIVTGGGRGIGKAIAVRMAKEGAIVAIVDKNPDTLKDTVEGIKKDGGRATAIVADLTKNEAVCRMVQTTMEQFGKIDILVNNVGLFTFEPFLDTKEEEWDRLLGINLKSTLLCSQTVLKEMVNKTYGKIVNISSDAARIGMTTMASYSAAKAGVMGLTKTLAREMARYNININCVCPGLVDTQLTAEWAFAPELKEKMIKAIPFRRLATPEDIAAAVCFFASDEASYITGQSLSVNGGQAMF